MWYKNKRVLTVAAIAAVIVLGVFVWLIFFNHPKHADLVTQPAAMGDVEKTVLASGTLEPYQEVNVGAQVSGQVTLLKVGLGDQVKKGDLIANINSANQKNSLATAQAQLNNITAQKAASLASLAQAQSNFTRQQTLYKADAGSQADYEAAEETLKSAQSSVDAITAQIDQAGISVNVANVNLGYTRISAPIDGTVIAIITKQGQTVNSNQSAPTIVVLGELDKMTVKAEISEADVIHIQSGMDVYFTTLGDPNKKYYGTLRSIEPAPTDFVGDTTPTATSTASAVYYYGLFDVDNPDGTLRPDMTAQVYIVEQSAKNVLTIPSAALGRKGKDGSYRVMVVPAKGKKPVAQKITIGVNDGTNVQVLSGLKAGDQVVIAQAQASGSSSSSGGGRNGGGRGGAGGLGGSARPPRGL